MDESLLSPSVWLGGEWDLLSADTVRAQLSAVLARLPDREIVLDLSGITFMSLAGLDPLLEWTERMASGGRTLVLRAVPVDVARLLELTGHDHDLVRDDEVGSWPSAARAVPRAPGTPSRAVTPVAPGSARGDALTEPDEGAGGS